MAYATIAINQVDADSEHLRALWRQMRDNIDALYDDVRVWALSTGVAGDTCTNSTVLQNSSLSVAVGTNETWRLHYTVLVTATAGKGVQFDITLPSSTGTSYAWVWGTARSASPATDHFRASMNVVGAAPMYNSGAVAAALASSVYSIDAIIHTGGVAGNVVLQFAQSVAGAATSTAIDTNSSVTGWRLDPVS